MNKKTAYRIGAVFIALILWEILAKIVNMDMLLASPLQVLRRLGSICLEEGFVKTLLFSAGRVGAGFLAAFLLGTALALAAGRFEIIEALLWPYVVTIKSVPVASFIILCLIWFTYSSLTVLISFLIAFPAVYSNVLQGIKSTDAGLSEMAELFKVRPGARLLYISAPAIKPYLLSSGTTAVGMAWKAGVAAEVIGVVKGSIGEKLYDSKIYFQNADLLAWTVFIVLLSIAMEKLFIFLLKKLYAGVEKL